MDSFLASALLPLGIVILLSGLDDMLLILICIADTVRNRGRPAPREQKLCSIPEKRLAIFVPCWHEAVVIGKMIEHNSAAIRYQAYDFFVGAYPNDQCPL